MDRASTAPPSKKRARSPESPVLEREDRKSKSDIENADTRERKDKKRRRKRQRKMSVVEEREGGPKPLSTSSSRASFTRSVTFDGVSAPPSKTNGKQPEFVQGSSSSTPASPQQDTVALKETMDTQKKSLDAHGALLGLMLPSLTCQICLDLLHKPFALAPCGHMACYNCLVMWFTTPPANDNVHELPQFRKKTCPHCRAVVRERPAEVWAVKEMVANVSRSGLAPQFPPPPSNKEEEAAAPVLPGQVAAVRDAWANIFPPLPRTGAPVPGMGAGQGEVAAMGMYDAEDHVYRCLDCMHEIWEGSCAQCGRIYPGHDDVLGLGSDDEGEEDVANIYAALHAGHVQGFHPAPGFHAAPFLSDSDGEGRSEDEESYDGSFIDDDGAPAPPGPRAPRARRGSTISLSSESEGESEVRALGRGWRVGRSPAPGPIAISDEGSDEDDDVLMRYPRRRPAPPARRYNLISDDEADVVIEVDSPASTHAALEDPAPSRRSRRYLFEESEEEEDNLEDDDGAIAGPSRRLRRVFDEEDSDDDEMHNSGSDDDGAVRGGSRRLMDLMGAEEDEDGDSDDERFGGRSDDDDERHGGDYGQFEDEDEEY
ncbi:unnamed protein product [Peniophora sp. CBMAI 1063]|nr:unnamed protein product [Peniophora sp. CBMAI 1063]